MNIRSSARLYLNAGLALTTASVLAFAPAVLHEPPTSAVHPIVSTPAVELAAAISPQDIQGVIDALEGAVNTVVEGAAKLAMLPATNLADGATALQTATFEFFTALIDSTDNTQLKTLLTGLRDVQQANLAYLVTTTIDLEGASQFWVGDMASLVQDTLNEAIAATVTSLAGVINNPLAFNSYTSLLGAGITTTFNAAANLVWLAGDVIQAPLDLADWAFSDLGIAATYPIANWSDFIAATLGGLAAQTGSPVVEGFTKALLAVTTTPLSYLATGLGDIAYWTPVYTAVIGVEQTAYAAANLIAPVLSGLASIGEAVTTIGNAPLDPASYVKSLQGFVTAGFNVGSEAIWSANQIAQIGPLVFNSLVNPVAIIAESLTTAVAHSVSGLLAAGGAPQNVVDAPIAFADNASNTIWNATNSVLNVSDAVANWVQDSSEKAMAANDAVGEKINVWLGGLTGADAPPGSATPAAAKVSKSDDTKQIKASSPRSSDHTAAVGSSKRSAKSPSSSGSASRQNNSRAHHATR